MATHEVITHAPAAWRVQGQSAVCSLHARQGDFAVYLESIDFQSKTRRKNHNV